MGARKIGTEFVESGHLRPQKARGISVGFSPRPSLQLPSQHLDDLTNGLLIAPIPSPLTMFGRLHQSGLCQNAHMMRNRRLR